VRWDIGVNKRVVSSMLSRPLSLRKARSHRWKASYGGDAMQLSEEPEATGGRRTGS
jgi:hypothetical protein